MGYFDEIEFYSKDDIEEYFGKDGINEFECYKNTQEREECVTGEIEIGGRHIYYIHRTERNERYGSRPEPDSDSDIAKILKDKRISQRLLIYDRYKNNSFN
jgi:hypothetical protein